MTKREANYQTEFEWGGDSAPRHEPRPSPRDSTAEHEKLRRRAEREAKAEADQRSLFELWRPELKPGKARYATALRVLPPDWEPRAGTPGTRAQCPTERPCPYVRCEWNLWMVDGRDRPGRRVDGRPPPSVVIAHVTQNCGADVADKNVNGEGLTVQELADAIGVSDKQVRRIVARAKEKLRQSGAMRGVMDEMEER